MDYSMLFGQYLVSEEIITQEDLSTLITIQDEINRSFVISALELEEITPDDLKVAHHYQREKAMTMEEALLALGIIDKERIEMIKAFLDKKRIKIGELLVKKGIISEDELNKLLAEFTAKVKYPMFLKRMSFAMYKKSLESKEA